MTIGSLSSPGSSSPFSPASSGANGRYPLQGINPSSASALDASNGRASAVVNLSLADFSSAASVLQALPPGTVQYGTFSSATTATSSLTSATASSSASEYSKQSSVESGSYDISFSTSLQTLQSLGLLQPGDVLTGSSVRTITQQAQLSTTQSGSVSQQSGSSSNGTQSSATVATQQTTSEQNVAVLVTQNWTTPNGVGFVVQEMVRVNQDTQTEQAGASAQTEQTGASASNAPSPDSLAGQANAIAELFVSLAPGTGSDMGQALSTSPNLQNGANASGSSTLSSSGIFGAMASGANAYLATSAPTAPSGADAALLKQTDSLLALLESLANVLLLPGANAPTGRDGAVATANVADS